MEKFMNLSKIIDFVIKEMTQNKKHLTYHNKNHILDCLYRANDIFENKLNNNLNQHQIHEIDLSNSKYKLIRDNYSTLKMPLHLFLAICFHDIYYDVGCDENEKNSALNMYSYICENCQYIMYEYKEDLDIAYDMILASKHHNTELVNENKDIFALFFDIDMSYFSLDSKEYFKVVKLIMKEYLSKYSKEDYINGRIKFLENFMNNTIFSHELFSIYNSKAKENILSEITYLSKLK